MKRKSGLLAMLLIVIFLFTPLNILAADTDTVYVAVLSGRKYHRQNCRTLANSQEVVPLTITQAAVRGYEPCKVCDPPAPENVEISSVFSPVSESNVWAVSEDGSEYWYENGVKQGTTADPSGVRWKEDPPEAPVRGREIYDPSSDAWYWLDADHDGAKATGKEVFMPYIYQNEVAMSDEEKRENAAASDEGLQDLVYESMLNGTGKWVRYDNDGKMLKGWVTIEGELAQIYPEQAGNRYYYDTKTGLMAKGDITINGVTYHFDKITGALQE